MVKTFGLKAFTADNENVRTGGRSLYENDIRYLSYTNSFIEFEFTGKYACAVLISDLTPSEDMFRAWFGVFIDGETVPSKVKKIDEKEECFLLYKSDTVKTVKIRIMKLSEAAFSKMGIKKIFIDENAELLPPPKPKSERRIEFIGDSITCGYGIDGVWNKDNFSTETENPIKGFAYKTALRCGAEFQYISWSGMGVQSCYVDENAEKPLDNWLVHDIYPYTDSGLENTLGREGHENHTKWDFSNYVPQVILFNMGTNDQSWTKDIKERRDDFCNKYFSFLKIIRSYNPEAFIICTYGIMGQNILEEEISCIERFKAEVDDRIKFVTLPVQLESDGIGADWHPSETSHNKVADILVPEINAVFESMGL